MKNDDDLIIWMVILTTLRNWHKHIRSRSWKIREIVMKISIHNVDLTMSTFSHKGTKVTKYYETSSKPWRNLCMPVFTENYQWNLRWNDIFMSSCQQFQVQTKWKFLCFVLSNVTFVNGIKIWMSLLVIKLHYVENRRRDE